MRSVAAFVLVLLLPLAVWADDKPLIVVSPPGSGTTIVKDGDEKTVLKETPNGTIGKMGKDKVILHSDGKGNTIGKIGKDKVFCHTDPRSGVSICK
ncbi:MAG: hypothetical protein HYU59_15945 [Magnetospirillum gryphiswaldense]|nr:hypothetical protein [Magnetospirillum gryphiswaldense]